MKIAFTIPGPPVPCARARVFAQGGRLIATTPAKTRAYEKHVAACTLAAMMRGAWSVSWAAYSLAIKVYREGRRGDADNYLKAIQDGITKARAWEDDAQVESISASLFIDREHPRVEVEIEMLGDVSLEERRAFDRRDSYQRRRASGGRA